MRHILDLAPDVLKLDMSLIREIHAYQARRAMAAAIVSYGDEIGCKVLAEDIECEAERRVLTELGVHYGQGYLFGRPEPATADFASLNYRRKLDLLIEEAAHLAAAARVLELPQRLRLDLADALSGHAELLADFLERVVGVHADAEAHPQHTLLARGQ